MLLNHKYKPRWKPIDYRQLPHPVKEEFLARVDLWRKYTRFNTWLNPLPYPPPLKGFYGNQMFYKTFHDQWWTRLKHPIQADYPASSAWYELL